MKFITTFITLLLLAPLALANSDASHLSNDVVTVASH